jgi:hypothetical protein
VFINGILVADLGGTHQHLPARVDVGGLPGTATVTEGGRLDPTTGLPTVCPAADPYTGLTANVATNQDGNGHFNCVTADCDCRTRTVNLGLTLGRTYELAIFAANRHSPQYDVNIWMPGSPGPISACLPRCGDGIVSAGEECDCGDSLATMPASCVTTNSDLSPGGCTSLCKLGPRCGDGFVDAGEQCDRGAKNNTGSYGTGGCTPGCQTPRRCGDGFLDQTAGEQCDLGDAVNGTAGAACSVICRISAP